MRTAPGNVARSGVVDAAVPWGGRWHTTSRNAPKLEPQGRQGAQQQEGSGKQQHKPQAEVAARQQQQQRQQQKQKQKQKRDAPLEPAAAAPVGAAAEASRRGCCRRRTLEDGHTHK
jgi:hypothetical protein